MGNYIGTNFAGTAAVPNSWSGVALTGGTDFTTVGGVEPGAGNVISGNTGPGVSAGEAGTSGNKLQGNFIGTNAAGAAAIPNEGGGVVLSDGTGGNEIGGPVQAAANVISGNRGPGIAMFRNATGNRIAGNFIGTDRLGTRALPNLGEGVLILSGNNVVTFAATDGFPNLISGNASSGVVIGSPAAQIVVAGSRIGTNLAGDAAVPNQGPGVFVFRVANTLIGGASANARNVISGNNREGISLFGIETTGTQVHGNYIGTTAAGTAALGNAGTGVVLNDAVGNFIGGTTAADRNVISGNRSYGVELNGPLVTDNRVEGNYIGTQRDGRTELGNRRHGVLITNGASRNVIGGTEGTTEGDCTGACNVIAFNGLDLPRFGHGIRVEGNNSTGNAIRRNSIHDNEGRGIGLGGAPWSQTLNDVGEVRGVADGLPGPVLAQIPDTDQGPNRLQNYPTILRFDRARGVIVWMLNSTPERQFSIDFFSNRQPHRSGFGDGERYLASMDVQTDGFGHAEFESSLEQFLSATATDVTDPADQDTSAFSVVDSDGDSLADTWETQGVDADEDGTVDLSLPGANPDRPDLFLEVDAMQGRVPNRTWVIDPVIFAFASQNISLHIPPIQTIPLRDYPRAWADFQEDKARYFDVAGGSAATRLARRLTYRYCIFANTRSTLADPDRYFSSGESEIVGNDFMITLGSAGTYEYPKGRVETGWFQDGRPGTDVQQLGTFMHEFGHTLGLRHGGGGTDWYRNGDDTPYKPDYVSLMNYCWQTTGTFAVPSDPKCGSGSSRRWPDYSVAGPDDWAEISFAFQEFPDCRNLTADQSPISHDDALRLEMIVPGSTFAFRVTASTGTPTAGTEFSITVTALDSSGRRDAAYQGTVTFHSYDPQATLPANYTFTAADAGEHVFTGVVLRTAGPQSVRVHDAAAGAVTGAVELTVIPGPVRYYYLWPDTGTVIMGVPIDLWVFPFDEFFNHIPTYTGEIAFWSTDETAVLPVSYTFLPEDGGVAYFFEGVTFNTVGLQELYVFDTATYEAIGYAPYDVQGPGGAPSGGSPGRLWPPELMGKLLAPTPPTPLVSGSTQPGHAAEVRVGSNQRSADDCCAAYALDRSTTRWPDKRGEREAATDRVWAWASDNMAALEGLISALHMLPWHENPFRRS